MNIGFNIWALFLHLILFMILDMNICSIFFMYIRTYEGYCLFGISLAYNWYFSPWKNADEENIKGGEYEFQLTRTSRLVDCIRGLNFITHLYILYAFTTILKFYDYSLSSLQNSSQIHKPLTYPCRLNIGVNNIYVYNDS